MAQRGQLSTAHEYDKNGQCIHCRMYKVNVDALSHVCIPAREMEAEVVKKVVSEVKNG